MVDGKMKWERVHSIVARTFIGPRPGKKVIDHINGIKTDNRVENLRYVENAENLHLAKKPNPSTGFIGVYKTPYGKFFGRVRFKGEVMDLGCVNSAEEAARRYDAKAREVFGDLAVTNY